MIALGSKVRDKISKFEGIATSRHSYPDGWVQIGVQPEVDKAKPHEHPDAISFDEAQVEVMGPGISATTISAPTDLGFRLGEEVEDKATGYRGIARCRSDFINGCVYVQVSGKAKKGEAPPKHVNVHYYTLKRVGVGISKMVPKAAPAKAGEAAPKTRVGGPPQRVERL